MKIATKIALSVGQAFAEICLDFGNQETKYERIYLPKTPLGPYLKELRAKEIINASTPIVLCTDWAKNCIQQRTGTELALLVTAGFEKWPYLRQPDNKSHFQQSPKRVDTILSDDYIFGIEERVNSAGQIIKPVNIKELEFLHQKFQLLGLQNIAIGFLNSSIEPKNLKICQSFFTEKSYNVITPDNFSDNYNEVARWWSSVLNTYICETYKDQYQSIFSDFKNINISSNQGYSSIDKLNYLSTSLGKLKSLEALSHNKSPILHFGMEEFLLVLPKENRKIWQSEFGPVALQSPEFQKVQVQPNQIIDFQRWDFAELTNSYQNLELGPVYWGRSMKITVLDILYALDKLKSVDILYNLRNANAHGRYKDLFYTLMEHKSFDLEETNSYFYDLMLNQIASDIVFYCQEQKQIKISGPLASAFFPELQTKLKRFDLELCLNFEFSECAMLIGAQNDSPAT